jgi:(p)ppGpp synthase/HD superfamily hydrolase
VYSDGVERALRAAVDAHAGQVRKGDRVPYFVHPAHVALLLARWGLDDEHIQAGLLHDVVEDCDSWTVERVEQEFGPLVAHLVDELTEDKARTWSERKLSAIENAASLSGGAALVKAADKLHNLETLRTALLTADDRASVWAQFKGGRERTLEMSAGLVEALMPRLPEHVTEALRGVLDELDRL